MIRLERSFRPKIWGSKSLGPWFADREEEIGEVWFTHTPPPPLLVKFIFTSDRLSVQVHPDDAYAAVHANSAGKTEMWHILRAEPGAAVAAGFRETIERDRARLAAASGEIEHLLEWLPVASGDTIVIPAGTVHAIGAGISLCEIQQYSDVTYRLYDYGRPRELHLNRALEVARLTPHPGKSAPRRGPDGAMILAECPYFVTELMKLASGRHSPAARPGEIVVVLSGAGEIDGQRFAPGEAWLTPEGTITLEVRAEEPVRMLRTRVPSPGDQPR